MNVFWFQFSVAFKPGDREARLTPEYYEILFLGSCRMYSSHLKLRHMLTTAQYSLLF